MIKLEEGENLILEGRKHWFIAFTNIVGFFLSAIIPIVVFIMAKKWEFTKEIIMAGGNDLANMVYFFCFIWALFMWVFLFINLTKYYLDVWYVTNKRLIDVDQRMLFHRDEAVLRLENIQDVATGAKGIIQTLLNFGNIRAQTAGERREFIMRDIANPERIREVIILEQGKVKDKTISVKVEEGNL
ncbi:MAG: PH domain-containing protein [Patescibacteria group bacterium]